jgi:hypothetical protein
VWWLQVVETMYSSQELANVHFMCSLADGNAVVSHHSYQEMYPGQRCPDRETFVKVSIATFVNMGILHLMLPTWDDQDLQILK